jgi:hypothetical protein
MAITAETWTKIVGGVVGVILLGLQGVNLSEISHGNENGQKRMQILEQLLDISKNIETSLQNQNKMLEHDSRSFDNQQKILETLTTAINERRDLLKQNLEEHHN